MRCLLISTRVAGGHRGSQFPTRGNAIVARCWLVAVPILPVQVLERRARLRQVMRTAREKSQLADTPSAGRVDQLLGTKWCCQALGLRACRRVVSDTKLAATAGRQVLTHQDRSFRPRASTRPMRR